MIEKWLTVVNKLPEKHNIIRIVNGSHRRNAQDQLPLSPDFETEAQPQPFRSNIYDPLLKFITLMIWIY